MINEYRLQRQLYCSMIISMWRIGLIEKLKTIAHVRERYFGLHKLEEDYSLWEVEDIW